MSDSTTIPHIKNNAIVNLSLGGDMISKLQSTLLYLTNGMKESESNALQEKITRRETLLGKDLAIVTVSTLLMGITKEAERTGQVFYRTVEETFTPQ